MLGTRAHSSHGVVYERPPGVERLSDSRYVVLILRLLVDKEGRVVHGEVGGAEEQEEERWIRFRGVDGLLGAVQAWLAPGEGAS